MAAAKPELPGQMLALEEHKRGRKRPRSSSGSNGMPQNEAARKASLEGLEDALGSIRPRGYQREMLEASIKQNIIVAMDTGSGKTQIAILRIRHELERCSNDKLVWFLAPRVPLAEQQYRAISEQLPAYQTKILTGADNLERWSTQQIWDAFLLNTRIVVSTPQILLDVLSNGFITLRRIALLVFDEAHHCVKASPENKIMRNFYHARIDQLSETNDLPSILGLTASPTSKLIEDSLSRQCECSLLMESRQLEQNLDAFCKTPAIHREEMMQYVHIPELRKISYQKDSIIPHNMKVKFLHMLDDIDIESDPFFQRYKGKTDSKSTERFLRALARKTPGLDQLKRCFTKVSHMYGELGHWASSAFISEIYRRTREERAKLVDHSWSEWDRDDSSFMCNALEPVVAIMGERCWNSTPDAVSQKVEHLVDLLSSELTGSSRGIIFVEQRATAVMLSHLISRYPELAHIKSDYFLGNSAFSARKADLTELSKPGDMKNSIDDLKSGKKNLLVATSVLEEGIDVSACDLVVCFDPPKQLRSFVQRRGRARKKSSKFVIFYAEDDTATYKDWEAMEDIMKERYLSNKEFIDRLREEDDEEEVEYESLRIESTGYGVTPGLLLWDCLLTIYYTVRALLTLENARAHLSHFCSTIPCEFTDTQPDFIISKTGIKDMLTAKVLLPTVLDLQFREFEGIQAWKREKMAKRDAAFQAYLQLYKASLVNDHLMPEHCRTTDEETAHIEKRSSMTTCSEVFNPWKMVADRWHSTDTFYQSSIVISSGTEELPKMILILPIPLPCDFTVKLFWNETSTLSASVSPQELTVSDEDIVSAPLATHILLSSVFPSRMNGTSRDFSCIFVPELARGHGGHESWCTKVNKSILGRDIESGGLGSIGDFGLARRTDIYARAWVAERFVWMKRVREEDDSESVEDEEEEGEILHVEGEKWPKRADFLHPVANSTGSKPHHTARNCIPARQSCISMLPVGFAKFALFIPSLIHTIGRYLLAEELSKTILSPIGFQNIQLVLTAITATSAREDTNYQRLEFLGDSALKLHASMQLLAEHPLWHEGILSKKKDSIVSNSRLWKAAVDTGLDQFILTTCFTGAKWRPLYNSTYTNNAGKIGEKSTRKLSTKTLADVVESLIGVAIIDGGENKVLRCLELFLPEINWLPSGERIEILYDSAPDFNDDCPRDILSKIEPLIDYSFTKKALLAASLSHPSNPISGMTYQRLEFLGDSILDNIVTRALFRCKREIPHQDMHLIRTALVNADFLAFLCMNTSTDETREDVCVSPTGEVEVTSSTRQVSLWQYMSHSSTDIVETQQAMARTFEELRDQIENALRSGARYPWTLLSTLNAPKFFSDIIESILGAIFIDSRGSILACQKFLTRIGLMDYLQRVLEDDGIDFMHPKQRLGVVAQSLSVQYVVSEVHVKPGVTQWKCQVLVGDEEISRVDDGVSQNQARAKAADLALEVLRTKN
ncbi:RNA helicase/RNAse III, putative [Trichophyton verrucosum HKI 0517]|uniref:RNA helicase/RNAse III, putative n=1 Tax=Trichophyton verrucosum (strain HKI 0517) TaxID=663202 RepID=D4D881_TRIVH|nr:RNA helicase/RNAse III, putative [Trichophyton verrucosum HKI 0517]EFE41937.1 RNA helicase/RNAse III, putative [Trichophyton verrucosum HKI 0517]